MVADSRSTSSHGTSPSSSRIEGALGDDRSDEGLPTCLARFELAGSHGVDLDRDLVLELDAVGDVEQAVVGGGVVDLVRDDREDVDVARRRVVAADD